MEPSASADCYNARASGAGSLLEGAPVTRIGSTSLDAVERLLVGLCRRDAGAVVATADLAQLSRKSFRNGLVVLASRHHVAGLMLVALQRHPGWGEIPSAIADDLLRPGAGGEAPGRGAPLGDGVRPSDRVRSFDALLSGAQRKDLEIERVLGRLQAEGLEPVVLKGPALRRTVYAHPVERHYSDFDLLFPVEHVDPAIEVVSAAGYAFPFSPEKLQGYRQLHFHVVLRQPRHFRAEIHWGLSRSRSPFQLDPKAFLRRSVKAPPTHAMPMRIPCPEHLLLHMAHENLRDSFSRFSRIVDVDRILASAPDLDWDYSVSQARDGGLESLLALSLELSRELLATAVPPHVLASLRPGAATRMHLRLMQPAPALIRWWLRDVGAAGSLQFWLSAGLRRRARLLLRLLGGMQSAEGWIFRESDQAPPTAREALAAGLKSGARLASHHAALYWNGLREMTSAFRLRR